MKNKIKSIREKVPQITTLPDGFYSGVWGGYNIVVVTDGKTYELETEDGVRGSGVSVVVEIKEGIATFDEFRN